MNTKLELKRIGIFLAFAYGIAWATALVIALTGGFVDSPVLIPALNITLGLALTATVYMSAPALAHVLTRVITREGWSDLWLRPRLRQGWPYWLAAWFLPAVLILLGAALYFLIFPGRFTLDQITRMAGEGAPNPWVIVIIQTLSAVLVSPFLNGLFTFGEEFGWRGYLLQKLLPMGARKAMLVSGIIWGMWHWPVILMGHNYGLEYPGAPWLGPLAMVVMTFSVGVFLSWVTLRGGSVWPAVIGHAVLNGLAALPLLLHDGAPNMVLGPAVAGVIGGAGFLAFALVLLARPRALESRSLLHGEDGAVL
jgi:membrane protease YdiL (CAAX protease family)